MSTVIVTQEETGTAVFACKFMRQRRHFHLRVKLELSPSLRASSGPPEKQKRLARPKPGGAAFSDWKRRRGSD